MRVIAPNSGIQINEQEVELVKMLANGARSKDIGDKWKVSPRTVEKQVEKLKDKTGTRTAAELVSFFYIHKLLLPIEQNP